MEGNWQLLGPAPASITRVNNRYRYHLTLSGTVNKNVRQLVAAMLCAAHSDKENHGVSVYADWKPAD
jgi:primosomal protein N' (replication factor Y)